MKRKKLIDRLCIPPGLGLLLTLPIFSSAEVDDGLTDSLRQALETQGWQAEQAEDGSIIYRKPTASVKTGQNQSATRTLQRKDAQDTLKERGWQMEWSPAGNLIMRPQDQADKAPEQTKPSAAGKPLDQMPDLPGFQYWRIEKQADGSLNFHPLAQVPGAPSAARETITLARCEGSEIKDAAISLPVDTWVEAQALAQAWLYQAGAPGLLVGKIRKVLGVYLISLVDDSPPYFLKHQLAIRASDGRVMLLE